MDKLVTHFAAGPREPNDIYRRTQCGQVAFVGLVWSSLHLWRAHGQRSVICSRCLEIGLADETATLLEPARDDVDLLADLQPPARW